MVLREAAGSTVMIEGLRYGYLSTVLETSAPNPACHLPKALANVTCAFGREAGNGRQ